MKGIVLAALVLLAGCVAPAASLEQEAAPPEGAWAYVCDGRAEVAPGVCAGTAGTLTSWLGEPAVGLQPNGSRAFLAAMASSPDGAATTRHAIHVLGFASEDGGATWTYAGPVPAPAGGLDHIDPTLVVDETGVIHYSGLRESGGRAAVVFYERSTDGGRTWSEPIVLSGETDKTVDRNWIARGASGTLYISWQEAFGTSRVAVSSDGGETWEQVTGIPGCDQTSRVIERGDEALLRCDSRETLIVAIDRATLVASERAVIDPGCGWGSLVDVGRAVQLVCETTRRYESVDGGATWTELEPLDLAPFGGWSSIVVSAAAGDARGVHILLREPHTGDEVDALVVAPLGPIVVARVAHLLTDANGTLVSTTLLTAEGAQQRRTDAGAAAWAKDDFHDVAIAPQGALLAWARGGGIDVAHAAWQAGAG